jgi:hypothetical protein
MLLLLFDGLGVQDAQVSTCSDILHLNLTTPTTCCCCCLALGYKLLRHETSKSCSHQDAYSDILHINVTTTW